MIDLHSHIIPNIDDGSRSMEMSLTMARQSVAAGVTHVVCTPHMHWGVFDNTQETIEAGFQQLTDAVADAQIPLALSWAAEVRLKEYIPQWLREDRLPFIGRHNGRPVLLLEMPHSHVPAGVEPLVRYLRAQGVQPLLPHPERNRDILKMPEKIPWLRNLGCWLQVTAGAITGRFGENVQALVTEMLAQEQVDVVASDMHDDTRRPTDMREAYDQVSTHLGEDYAQKLFVNTPADIIAEQPTIQP
ncbi:histidinol-phosphatase [Alteromonas sp. ASW11-19]|uniref:protein-tyrosine-phosphatase n=1 Tax=Alteromonas salexigens TaxID=2982530 RepID=A0ABT2VS50_9ALTE|nr:CpsB/CapC family capsule biosynthesis tyrosine phosphatase [Alteromonas salexigens]MCU7556116.1 histidinol-phosphatase [Alteromonas salexigens]